MESRFSRHARDFRKSGSLGPRLTLYIFFLGANLVGCGKNALTSSSGKEVSQKGCSPLPSVNGVGVSRPKLSRHGMG